MGTQFTDRALIVDFVDGDDKYDTGIVASPIMEFLDGNHLNAEIFSEGEEFEVFGDIFELGKKIDSNVRPSAEKTTALRKLLEVQDAVVRALKFQAFEE
jgi:hypothetical protein